MIRRAENLSKEQLDRIMPIYMRIWGVSCTIRSRLITESADIVYATAMIIEEGV